MMRPRGYPSALYRPMSPRSSSTMRAAVVRETRMATVRKMAGNATPIVSMQLASVPMEAKLEMAERSWTYHVALPTLASLARASAILARASALASSYSARLSSSVAWPSSACAWASASWAAASSSIRRAWARWSFSVAWASSSWEDMPASCSSTALSALSWADCLAASSWACACSMRAGSCSGFTPCWASWASMSAICLVTASSCAFAWVASWPLSLSWSIWASSDAFACARAS